jgi:prephenate dehydrogenase
MAGSERTGVKAAKPDLFENAVCVVTPTPKSRRPATRAVEGLWRSLGGRVLRLTPEVHDAIVSRTSHLVQIAAATLVHSVLSAENSHVAAQLCASGFRDTTRIASGSPEMWRDIALANREQLARAVSAYIRRLQSFERLLQRKDAAGVHSFFQEAAARRNRWRTRADRRLRTSKARAGVAR